jgi:hypothetical protein
MGRKQSKAKQSKTKQRQKRVSYKKKGETLRTLRTMFRSTNGRWICLREKSLARITGEEKNTREMVSSKRRWCVLIAVRPSGIFSSILLRSDDDLRTPGSAARHPADRDHRQGDPLG